MSHWAEIDENKIVLRVLVGNNNEADEGESFMNSLGGTWVKTSYNGNIRKNFAGISYSYDDVRDAFIAPKPYPSWILNEDTCRWDAPVAYPTDGKLYEWTEATTSWTGALDTDWFNSNNWSNCIPGPNTVTTIPDLGTSANYPIINGSQANVYNITIQGSGTVQRLTIGTGSIRVWQ
jgi:hypothetical protein